MIFPLCNEKTGSPGLAVKEAGVSQRTKKNICYLDERRSLHDQENFWLAIFAAWTDWPVDLWIDCTQFSCVGHQPNTDIA
jgi:hypothetical protein